jgi:hypothetical protein
MPDDQAAVGEAKDVLVAADLLVDTLVVDRPEAEQHLVRLLPRIGVDHQEALGRRPLACPVRALMAAGPVDRVQVTLFPVITGQTGLDPIFQGAADFDLELVEHQTLDGHIQELIYRPTLH